MGSPLMNRETFIANLRKSKLFSSESVDTLAAAWPCAASPEEMAASLVEAGRLTRFQADSILAGKVKVLVLGEYVILRQIGKGGLGRVYKAVHRTMNRLVAIKILAASLLETENAKRLFEREVHAAAKLHHPNIVTAYDASTKSGRYYLVMEYVHGPNLEELVTARGPLNTGTASEIIRQASIGLQHAHELNMLHRDIKPANILLQRGPSRASHSWTVKLVDFGLARFHTACPNAPGTDGTILLRQNTVMGTPDYISPEQARNMHDVDIRSDLYALGCTFYYLLTGRVVFPGGTGLEKLIRHSQDEPPPLERLRPDLSPEVVAIVRKLLAKNPRDRYQRPLDLVQALRPLIPQGPSPSIVFPDVPPTHRPAGLAQAQIDSAQAAALPFEWNEALQGTWPADGGPTPVPADDGVRDVIRILNDHKRRSSRFLLLGAGVFIGLLILLSYMVSRFLI